MSKLLLFMSAHCSSRKSSVSGGQSCVLHDRYLFRVPMQYLPPFDGAGELHSRDDDCTPPPHVRVHWSYLRNNSVSENTSRFDWVEIKLTVSRGPNRHRFWPAPFDSVEHICHADTNDSAGIQCRPPTACVAFDSLRCRFHTIIDRMVAAISFVFRFCSQLEFGSLASEKIIEITHHIRAYFRLGTENQFALLIGRELFAGKQLWRRRWLNHVVPGLIQHAEPVIMSVKRDTNKKNPF